MSDDQPAVQDPGPAPEVQDEAQDDVQEQVLDVREVPKPQRHPRIFALYDSLPVGGSILLLNDHDPRNLGIEFELEHPGSHGWEYVSSEPGDFRIRITRLASTPLPRVLTNTADVVAATEPEANGAQWSLPMSTRDLDSNVIALPAGGVIAAHAGPDLDVMLHVLAGAGTLTAEVGAIELRAGDVVWMPRRSRREIAAGPDGLRYLTVHQRRRGLQIDMSRVHGTAS